MRNIVRNIKIVLNYTYTYLHNIYKVFFFTRNIREIIINLNYILNIIVQNCSNYYDSTMTFVKFRMR